MLDFREPARLSEWASSGWPLQEVVALVYFDFGRGYKYVDPGDAEGVQTVQEIRKTIR